ncbi:hypothetical protein [uncultured Dokdonia sp.]|nr:hypothetical protein [uncultured Dokdonia sp.]
MKKLLTLTSFLILSISAIGQVKVGDNPNTINASSLLELESTNKVLVATRVSTSQMNSISPLAGGLVFNTDESCFYQYDGSNWLSLCQMASMIVDNGDGTYTYTDANGNSQIINTQASSNPYDNTISGLVATNVQDAIDEINAAAGTVALVDNGDGTYIFTDASGTATTIADTSISTLVDNGDGTYTYTDETGATQIIDISAEGNSFDNTGTGLLSTNVQDAIEEINAAIGTVGLIDNGDGTYQFTDASGTTITISDTSISTLVDNGDGTYTYTDETGATQIIDTNASANPYDNSTSGLVSTNVQDAIDEILNQINSVNVTLIDNNDGTYTFTDVLGNTTTISDTSISTLVDNADGTYTYTDEMGATQVIDTNASANPYDNSTSGLAATNVQDAIDEINAAAGTVALVDNGDGTYDFTDANGTTTTIADTSISTLVDNADGTYTYTDETGATQVIDTNASANPYDNTTSGLAATNVQDAIDEINAAAGTVALVDNGDGTYDFTDASGTTTTIADTSISTLVDNADGTYTYTDETGATQVIDTNASANPYDNTTSGLVATNVQDAIDEINVAAGTVALVDNGDGTYDFTDASGTTTTIADTSISTLVDNADGTYTYTDETGATQVIDTNASANPYDNSTSGLVATNVQDAIDEINAAAGTVALVDNGDGTYDFTDASGTTTTIADTSISTLVDNADGTYTYTDETGATQVIDTNASANPYDNTTSGLVATNVQDAIDEINAAAGTVALVDNGDGTYDFTDASGTTTTIADTSISTLVDNADGTYTYTDETGATQVIDTNASANPYDNTTSGLAATNVQDAIDEINAAAGTVALVDNGDGTYDFTDASGTTTTIADTSISTLVDNADGTYTYTDETGATQIIDTNASANPYDNSTSGLAATNVQDAIDEINAAAGTVALVDNGDGTYDFTDASGTTTTIADTSVSTLVDNGNGTYGYTDETGITTVIDTNGFNITNTVAGNTIATVTDAAGNATDINETVTTFADAMDGLITYTDENGDPQTVAKSDITDNENGTYTFTNNDGSDVVINTNGIVVADINDGKVIATITEADGTLTNIEETITELAIAAGELTYANEDATNANVNLISTDADNNITAGADGALFVDVTAEQTVTDVTDLNAAANTNLIGTYNNEDATPFAIEETVTELAIAAGELTFANEDATNANVNLISADADNNITAGADGALFVDVSEEETVTELAIAAGELTYANEDATNANVNLISADTDNNITAGTDGALFVDVTAEQTVTDVTDLNAAANTNLIGTYNNEDATPFAIEETVTELAIAAGELTYANEDATNANVNLISTDVDNNITAGADGALFVDVSEEETVTELAIAAGELTYANEDATNANVNLISADADNNITAGADGALFVDVSEEETVTELAIAAGELTYANEDATNANVNLISADADNNITAGTDGALFVDVTAEQTVTDVTDLNAAANTNLIGTYNNEDATPFAIEETVTELAIAAGELTYANEDATNANVNLISADADNNITAGADGALFVDVSEEETVTELAIAAGELTYANEDATNANVNLISADADNNITAGADGALFVDVTAEQTVTDVTDLNAAANTNLIGTYNNEDATPFAIEETVTELAIAAGELTYANEDATNANVNLISADADNNITAGADGALFVDVSEEETVTELAIAAGELTYANEDATNANVNLISADTDNNITAGTDGALFVDVTAEQTVTDVTDLNAAANTNLIGTYNNEDATPFAIEETVTELAIAAGELTYANEDATNANVNLISADTDNNITAGADGALFVDVTAEQTVTDVTDLNAAANTNLIGTYNNEDATPFAIEETVTELAIAAGELTYANEDATNANVNLISADADNNITAGADGALFVDVSEEETVTELAIAAGELTYANEDATNANVNLISADADNNITAGTDGALFVDVSEEETVTELAIAAGELTYANEDATNANVNLISADADNNITAGADGALFVDVSEEETVTELAIAAGELTYANEDATNANVNLISADADNNITAGADGALFVDVTAEQTVTDVTDLNAAANTNLIGTYNNEDATPFAIEETVTELAIAAGELTYANEDATNANVNLISADADNNITAGADGALFVDVSEEETVTELAIAAGELTYANEDATNANVNLISADADNNITAGADGALFVDVTAEQTVTDVTDLNAAANTNLIGTYNNEDATPFAIEETVTELAIAAGELTYANEDATNANVNLISADADNNITAGADGALFVDVSEEETVTELAIAAGELTYANEDATNANVNLISADADNNITAGADGALFVDVTAEQTVTDVTDLNAAANTNLIGTYNNEDATPFAIEETVTELAIAAGELTYANEDATNANVNLISADADNNITAGADGALFVDVSEEETVTELAIAAGELTYANEDATNANVNLISTDVDNNITAGADGALFVDVSEEETVTELAIAAGELTYANEDATNANVNLISADADNNITAGADGALFVDVSEEETVTELAIAAGELTYANEDATNANVNLISTDVDNNITAGADGALFVDVSEEETVTELAIAAGELTYANEDATNANVNLISADADNNITAGADGALFVDVSEEETVTELAIAAGELTYANEDATNANVNLISADADNNITAGADGALFVDVSEEETVTELAIAAGELTYANEDATNANVNLISADTDNNITAGTDGALFVDVTAEETVTDVTDLNTATNTNLIGTYNNEGATPFAIEETVTSLTFDDTTNELEFIDETGTPNPVDLSSLEHTGTEGSIFFAGADETPTEDNDQLFWDATNNRLGVGTNTPDNKLQVTGAIRSAGFLNSDGNAGEPAYRFTDDTNTGMYSPAADEIGFTVGGFEAMKIDEATTGNTVVIINQTLDLDGPVLDENDLPGTAGQVLTATATGTEWADAAAETVTTFVQDDTPTTTDATATGEITYTDEAGNPFTAQVVSADADNALSVGTDGGAFMAVAPAVYSVGKVGAAGGGALFNATVVNTGTGTYQVTFTTALPNANYIIQLSQPGRAGAGNDDPGISYSGQSATGFIVNIGDNDNGGSDRAFFNSEFMFTVLTIPGF